MIEWHHFAAFDILALKGLGGINLPHCFLIADPGLALVIDKDKEFTGAVFQHTITEYGFFLRQFVTPYYNRC